MTASLYKDALKRVLVHEGGKVDHPRDPGGRTNQGVIQRVYDGYRKRKNQKARDVWTMTNAERDEIYRRQYWDVIRGDELPDGIDYVVFDGAVNSGPSQSVKWLQRALGLTADGHLGESTLRAANDHPDHDALVNAICDRRLAFLKALRTWPTFGKGWGRRVAEVRRNGLALARGRLDLAPVGLVSTVDTEEDGGNVKANLQDASPAPQTATADAAAGGGAIGTPATAGALDSAKDALAPVTGSSKWIDLAFTVLVVAGVAITIGGLMWGLYARKKRKERADVLDLASEGVS